MNSKIIASMMGLLLIISIIIVWPKQNKVHLSPEVEVAINSAEPVYEVIPVNSDEAYYNFVLGNWSHLGVRCFEHPEWNDGHVSRNKLKRNQVVLKRKD